MKILRPFFLLFTLVLSGLFARAQQELVAFNSQKFDTQKIEDFAYSKQWLGLLHYQKQLFGGYKSLADDKSFFFAELGPVNPEAELRAGLIVFTDTSKTYEVNKNPQCRFPLRFRILQKEFSLNVDRVSCPDLETWMGSLKPKGLAYVYADNFPNSPSSVFGHTFLRIYSDRSALVQGAKADEKALDILDYVVGYAAHVDGSDDPVSFAIKGLFGGYTGQFNLGPYYLKINEYNNLESRDLWEYQLDFNAEETRMILYHLWELAFNNHFDYYFFDENCATLLLNMMAVAKPDWPMINPHAVYVSPPATVKKLYDIPGAITQVRYRPSMYKKLNTLLASLTAEELVNYKKIINSKKVGGNLSPRLVDTALLALNFKKYQFAGKLPEDWNQLFAKLLLKRSQMKSPATKPEIETPSGPHQAHGDHRVGLSFGWLEALPYQQIEFRPAVHDLLEHSEGQPKNSDIEVLKIQLRHYPQQNQLKLNDLNIINVQSLFPLTSFESKFSFAARFGFRDAYRLCQDCLPFYFLAKGGWTWELKSLRSLASILFGFDSYFSEKLSNTQLLGGSVHLQWLSQWDPVRIMVQLSQSEFLDQPRAFDSLKTARLVAAYLLSKNWSLRLNSEWSKYSLPEVREHSLSLLYNF